ncbi:MAG: basic amino acid ABC transporter substrate-binding protein, partial [Rubrivivax sp.]
MTSPPVRRVLWHAAVLLMLGAVLGACGKHDAVPAPATTASAAAAAPSVATYTVGTDAAYAPFESQN